MLQTPFRGLFFQQIFRMLFVLFLSLISGCSTLTGALKDPELQLQQVDLGEADLSKATLIFHFLVKNPNSVDLSVDQLEYKLQVNGKPLTAGVLEEGLRVGARSSVTIPLPVAIKYSDLSSSLSQLFSQGSSAYLLSGIVKMGLLRLPFEKKGELNLSDLQKK